MAGAASRINGQKGGRPRGYETEETKTRRVMRRIWLEKVGDAASRIFDAQLDLALGHYVQINGPDGPLRVYKRSPDGKSLQWIMEQVWGKAEHINPQEYDTRSEDPPLSAETLRDIKRAVRLALPLSRSDKKRG